MPYSICGKNEFDLKNHEWTACSEDAFLLQRASFAVPAANTLEDALYNFTRPVKTLRVELPNPSNQQRYQQRSPAMAAGITDHIWTVQELLTVVLVPLRTNT